MKFLILAINILFEFGRTLKSGQFDVIPSETPKASTLSNIFGKTGQENTAGAMTQMTVFGPNGRMEVLYQNTKDLNTPALNLCSLRDEPTIKLCESLSCDLCMNSAKCGWCLSTSKCVPGTSRSVSCEKDCVSSWIFSDLAKCESSVKSGNLKNIAPEAQKLINPGLAEPKLAIHISNPDVIEHSVKIKYGEEHIQEEKTFTTNDGTVHNIQENSVKPLIGELMTEIEVRNRVEEKFIDLKNGTELKRDRNLKTFGIEPNTTNTNSVVAANTTNSSTVENGNPSFFKQK